ncbi:MAG: CerR family C-terminal domain-containing protein [Halioglobus sp.]
MTAKNSESRSGKTRDTLIRSAIEVFGRAGYDAASTRAIADRAGANQALISYHFGGKKGLYLAVFEYIGVEMRQVLGPIAKQVTTAIQALPAGSAGQRELVVPLLCQILDGLLEVMARPESESWARIILREQQDPTEAFDLIWDFFVGKMLGLVTHLVAIGSGMDENSDACKVRAEMTLGQVLIFLIARGTTARHMQWSELGSSEQALIRQQLRHSLERQFSTEVSPP